ncbi:unnamed protein product [Boreogadus saida]
MAEVTDPEVGFLRLSSTFHVTVASQSKLFDRSQSDEEEGQDVQSCAPLTGVMGDCFCDIESIDSFNNIKVYPRAKRLTERLLQTLPGQYP